MQRLRPLVGPPRVAARLGQFSVLVALVIGLLAVITACGGSSGGAPGQDPGPGTKRVTVGEVSVRHPSAWVVLDRPDQGWDWTAQDVAGDAATVQLAVDGDYSALDPEFATASLLAAAQVGSYPGFSLQHREEIEVDGAGAAIRSDFTYRVGAVEYQAVWVVARGSGERTSVVQLSGRKPLAAGVIAATVDGIRAR